MIKIDINDQNHTQFKGNIGQICKEMTLLTHMFITDILPKMRPDVKEEMKQCMALAWIYEFGIETLQECGVVGDIVTVDASKLDQLKQEGRENETEG